MLVRLAINVREGTKGDLVEVGADRGEALVKARAATVVELDRVVPAEELIAVAPPKERPVFGGGILLPDDDDPDADVVLAGSE